MMTQAVREPPILNDRQLYTYLQEMARQVNYAMQQVDAQLTSPDAAGGVIARAAQAAEATVGQQTQNLRALIVQTASDVQAAMDELSASLRGSYVARSEWGSLREDISAEISATADGIVQEYGFAEAISDLKAGSATFDEYRLRTLQYIKTGLLYYETVGQSSIPRYGVAVGEKLTTELVNGEELLTRTDLCATFTSDRLSFWQGGVEVAYVSNNRLNIPSANVTGSLRIGPWEISHTSGLIVKYVG